MCVGIKNNNNWTYDLNDHLMVDLNHVIVLASMFYYIESKIYKCFLVI